MFDSEIDSLKKRLQTFFVDGLVVIVGSGLSLAEGISGMGGLAEHLKLNVKPKVKGKDSVEWGKIEKAIDRGIG